MRNTRPFWGYFRERVSVNVNRLIKQIGNK